jgi:hypothetical protein
VEKAGLQLYSARITPAKGGPLLHLGANYPHSREGVEPLTEEESDALRLRIKQDLLKSGYKSKVLPFVYNDDADYNDFRLRVLLREKDVDMEKYRAIRKLWKARRDARRL